jgi:F-box/leucine-rich repeat protein 2/20
MLLVIIGRSANAFGICPDEKVSIFPTEFLFASLRRVRFLSLEGCALLTTSGIEAVVVMWRELHTLQVSCCDSVSDSEIGPALAAVFSMLKVLKWCPDIKSLLAESLAGTGVGQAGGKFFRRAQ